MSGPFWKPPVPEWVQWFFAKRPLRGETTLFGRSSTSPEKTLTAENAKNFFFASLLEIYCGEGGIRTPGTRMGTVVFRKATTSWRDHPVRPLQHLS